MKSRVHRPKQVRSQETFDRLVDAAEQLLEERDYDDITVADIVGLADRTIGSFYARFVDKDAALLALAERLWLRDRAVLEAYLDPERWIDQSLEEMIRTSITMVLSVYRSPTPALGSTIFKSADDDALRVQRREMFTDLYQLCRRAALSKVDEIMTPDPEWAIAVGFRHVTAVLDHLLLFGSFWSADDVPDAVLVEDLVDFQMRLFRAGVADDR